MNAEAKEALGFFGKVAGAALVCVALLGFKQEARCSTRPTWLEGVQATVTTPFECPTSTTFTRKREALEVDLSKAKTKEDFLNTVRIYTDVLTTEEVATVNVMIKEYNAKRP
jgi:hypothetical protein